jgi:succinate dehydrogenase / fumarate reductase cytochrome b subunit
MALSGLFLMVFLLQHLSINLLSVFNPKLFNDVSHFMGTNYFIQFVLQPVLIGGFFFHLIMGFILDLKNRKSTSTKYAYTNSNNSTWVSRNMIITGLMIFSFICLHFYDFWIPEINTKFINGDWSGLNNGEFRYYDELQHKFHDLWRVILYVVSFFFLSLHLLHGFQSSFQSVGVRTSTATPIIKKISSFYAILVPAGFVLIAIYHYLAHLTIII